MNKKELCKEIGNYFGTYFEEDGKFCIDNEVEIFRYDTEDELLKDWLDTIIENHKDTYHIDEYGIEWDSWKEQIAFIYENVLGVNLKEMKLKCLQCEYEFNGTVELDELGWHSSCPKCGGSFDVDKPY